MEGERQGEESEGFFLWGEEEGKGDSAPERATDMRSKRSSDVTGGKQKQQFRKSQGARERRAGNDEAHVFSMFKQQRNY